MIPAAPDFAFRVLDQKLQRIRGSLYGGSDGNSQWKVCRNVPRKVQQRLSIGLVYIYKKVQQSVTSKKREIEINIPRNRILLPVHRKCLWCERIGGNLAEQVIENNTKHGTSLALFPFLRTLLMTAPCRSEGTLSRIYLRRLQTHIFPSTYPSSTRARTLVQSNEGP